LAVCWVVPCVKCGTPKNVVKWNEIRHENQYNEKEISMPDENLRKILEQLHDELERTESVDETGDELLRHLNEDIRSLLQRSGRAEVQADDSVLERWQNAVDHFEVTHPTLTTLLSEMMTILSNAGI
jgi:arsenate reductase-like glutaredoxin family protein